MNITYHCPKCALFADKKRSFYDHSAASSCIYTCTDCRAHGDDWEYLDENGERVKGAEITMARWPTVDA